MHGGSIGGVWTTEIIICLVVDHAWTMENIRDQGYIHKKKIIQIIKHF